MGIKLKKEKQQFFQFKQFRVWQDKTAMKICTDACIFGASVAVENSQNILDIGTGTGLLALMLAQKTKRKISAVEIEENAFLQAKENFEKSIWKNQLHIFHTSIQDFAQKQEEKFDLIISNPPFFKEHLQTNDLKKNLALHNNSLSFEELVYVIIKLLDKNGKFCLLLPEYETEVFVNLAKEDGLYLQKQTLIYHHKQKKALRVISIFGKKQAEEIILKKLYIKNLDQTYTQDFINLLQDYYLIF